MITIGIVEAFKGLGVPTKWCPILAIFIGLGLSALAFLVENKNVVNFILMGIILGLTSVGLFSTTKTIKEGFFTKKEGTDQPAQ